MKNLQVVCSLLLALITLTLIPVNAQPQPFLSPKISIDPVSGSVGTSIRVSGAGFAFNSEVKVYWEEKIVATAKTNEEGSFSTSFTAPEAPCGYYKITAIDEKKYNAYTSFRIMPKITKLSVTKAPPGSSVNISGNGFTKESEVVVYFIDPFNESIVIAQEKVLANSNGVIQLQFGVPDVLPGDYRIYAIDSRTGLKTEFQKFRVEELKTTPTPTSSKEESKEETKDKKPTPTSPVKTITPAPYAPKSTPGFEVISAILGIAMLLLLGRRHR
ncbi:MAG: hypothetical protein QXN34_02025 [Archaeoglobaceae archaeon]